MGTSVFAAVASGFAVKFHSGKTGFASPWKGYPAANIDPIISSVLPASIPGLIGNQTITINGVSFVNKPTLEFEPPDGPNLISKDAKLTFNSSTKITYLINTDGSLGTWKLRVKNPDGNYSNWQLFEVVSPQATKPAAPTNLRRTDAVGGAIALKWDDKSNNESGFRIQRSAGINAGWFELNKTSANFNTYSDSNVSSGITYSYKVVAYNAAGNSTFSNTLVVPYGTTVAPTISVTSPAAGTVWSSGDIKSIQWTASGEVSRISFFRVSYSLDGGANYTELATAVPSSPRQWSIPSNLQSAQARIKVEAFDSQNQPVTSGSTSNFTLKIPVLKPVASPNTTNNAPTPGTPIQFTSNGTTVPSGRTVTSYQWDFGDGTPQQTGANPTHTYAQAGVYTATLTVTDSAGESHSRPLTVTVTGNAMGNENQSGQFADPVNLATGNFLHEADDITIPGMGFPIKFGRFYNSKEVTGTGLPIGQHWTHSYNMVLTEVANPDPDEPATGVTISFPDGRTQTHAALEDGTYLAESGVFDRLTKTAAGRYRLTTKEQLSYNFESGRLVSISDRNGNTQTLEYSSNRLSRITDISGRYLAFAYNADGRVQSVTDPLGRSIQYGYDAASDLVTVTNARSGVNRYGYDALHQMTTATDPKGNVYVTNIYDDLQRVVSVQKDAYAAETKFSYDFTTRLTTVTDPFNYKTYHQHDDKLRLTAQTNELGYTESYGYDDQNNRTLVVDRNGNATRYTYDSRGNVISKTDPYQSKTFIEYNTNNDPVRRVDPLGNVTTFTYDAKGNLVRSTDPLLRNTAITVNANGKALSITDRNNNTTSHTYDPAGNKVQTRDAMGGNVTMTYDEVGRLRTTTDQNLKTSQVTYDENDNVRTVTNALTQTVTNDYDANDNRIRTVDARGNATGFEYDAKDRLITVTDAENGVVRHQYDAYDRKKQTTDARGKITRFDYDGAGHLIATINPLTQRTEFGYDPNGNRISVRDALGRETRSTYDKLNRLTSVSDALGNTARMEYDLLGRKIKSVDALGRLTGFQYDPLGRLLKVTDPAGGTVVYTYDAEGNRLTTTNARLKLTTNTYDKLNRLVKRVEPNARAESYTYDPAGNRIGHIDAMNRTVTYEYDPANRLKKIIYPSGTPVGLTYDANGNRVGMTDSVGTSSFVYDKLNRMTQYTSPFQKSVAYGYDPNSNRISMTYPGSKQVTYIYDDANRMSSVQDWQTRTTSYIYNAAGELTGSTNPNGTSAAYTYDAAARLATLSNLGPASAVISNYAYTLDAVGNHRKVDGKDPVDSTLQFTDGSSQYDDEDRMTAMNGDAHTYDANGNLLAIGTDATLAYDFENRLSRYQTPDGTDWSFRYDGAGNRMEMGPSASPQRFVLDLNTKLARIIGVTDQSGTFSEYYIYGLGLVSKVLPDNTAEFYHFDSRGSTVAMTNGSGAQLRAFAYDPFGRLLARLPKNAPIDRFTYLGRHGVANDQNGFLYVRARYYSPQRGRFLTKDSFLGNDDQSQTLNRFVYALNNPVRLVDVSGFNPWDIVKNFVVGVVINVLADVGTPGADYLKRATHGLMHGEIQHNYGGVGNSRDASQDGAERVNFQLYGETWAKIYGNELWWAGGDEEKALANTEKYFKQQQAYVDHDNRVSKSGSTFDNVKDPKVAQAHKTLSYESESATVALVFDFMGRHANLDLSYYDRIEPIIPEHSETTLPRAKSLKK